MVGETGQMAWTVAISMRTRVRVPTALAVRISDETVSAEALVATGSVHAFRRRMTRVRVAEVDFLAAYQRVAGVTGSAVADSLMVLRDASGVNSATVDAWIFTVEIRETGLFRVTIFIFETLHLTAAVALIVRISNVVAMRAGAFW